MVFGYVIKKSSKDKKVFKLQVFYVINNKSKKNIFFNYICYLFSQTQPTPDSTKSYAFLQA